MLKSFKTLQENDGKQYCMLVDCTDKTLDIEYSLTSLKSIFSSLPAKTPFIFFINEKDSILSTLIDAVYTQIHADVPDKRIYKCLLADDIELTEGLIKDSLKFFSSEYVCFLKLGICVSTTFISKLVFCLKNFNQYYKLGNPGLVVPVFNAKVGNQYLLLPNDLEDTNLQSINNKLVDLFADNSKPKWILSGICSDICYVIPIKVIENVGLPNYSLKKQYDSTTMMSEYSSRLLNMNYTSVIAGDTYVFFPNPEKYVPSNSKFLKDENVKERKTLAVLYKIHLRTEYQRDIFIKSVKQMSSIADKIYVIDCSSSVKLSAYMRENIPDVWNKITKYKKIYSPTDDKRDFNELLLWAEEDCMDWVLSLEGNETLPDTIDRSTFDKLMSPPHIGIMGYALSEFYMWNDTGWRYDGVWLNSSSVRLFKVIPGRRIEGAGLLATQCGYGPVLPKENIRFSNIVLLIWNFSSPQERQEAYKYVTSVEPTQNWNYFLDEKTLAVCPLSLGQITTYSPVGTGGDNFIDWLEHVWSWSDRIVLGNDRKQLSQEYIDIATEQYGVTIVPCSMEKDFAAGRNEILEKIETSHVFQLDIDERISDPRVLIRLTSTPSNAFMFAIDNLQKQRDPKNVIPPVVTSTVRLFNRLDGKVKYWGYIHETIDDAVRKFNMNLMQSPVKLLHYGYVWMTDDYAYTKMQRYMEMNIRQMTDFPDDPRSYYNLAMHLIEDGILDTALRLLNICIVSSKASFILPIIELTKLHLLKTLNLCGHLSASKPNLAGGKEAVAFAEHIANVVKTVVTSPIKVAPGHAINFFQKDKVRAEKLNELVYEVEKKLNII